MFKIFKKKIAAEYFSIFSNYLSWLLNKIKLPQISRKSQNFFQNNCKLAQNKFNLADDSLVADKLIAFLVLPIELVNLLSPLLSLDFKSFDLAYVRLCSFFVCFFFDSFSLQLIYFFVQCVKVHSRFSCREIFRWISHLAKLSCTFSSLFLHVSVLSRL